VLLFEPSFYQGRIENLLSHCALSLVAQCIIIGPVCLCVGVFVNGLLPR